MISGCIEFESIDQPRSASLNQVLTVYVETYTEGGNYSPYFGVCLPTGWSVPGDSILCTGVYNEAIYYDSLVSSFQENASPAPEGYYWWAASGPEGSPAGSVYAEFQIQNDDQLGCFSIDYMLGNSYDGVNQDRSDGHLIWVVDEYTPTGLQVVEGDDSVILNWHPPVDTTGLLGYDVYRDQQIINIDLVEDTTYIDDAPLDGAHFYALSSLYDGGNEYPIPYEVLLFFGEYVYVSPDGDNSNDGSSFDDAFLTITYSLSMIRPDSLHPKTILLAPGIYSPDSTGEEFPISFISYLSLAGAQDQASILDADSSGIVIEFIRVHDASATASTLKNGAGAGISCLQSNPTISDITISGCSFYGIDCSQSNPTIINNTISGNYGAGGIRCYDSSPQITNTIIWANTESEVVVEGISSPVITYCDISGGWENDGNIDVNPLFVDPDNGNYNVYAQSPCIDAGDPGVQDPDGTRSDIGVFYAEHPECPGGNIWYVSTAGNDTTGDGSPGDPFRTIQHAIDVSIHFDTVVVETGTYAENINIYLKRILLGSNYMFSGDTLDIQNTIIDGNLDNSVVTFAFCDSLTAITGFTIRNGDADLGGGIHCFRSSPSIIYNTVSGNSANTGGGIYCDGDFDPIISDNNINGNTATWQGGGIASLDGSNPRITGNTISGNTALGRGGGIYCSDATDPIISNNTIRGNVAGGEPNRYYEGGGIYCSESQPIISDNTIDENTANDSGGGIFCRNSTPIISNNNIYGNTAYEYWGGGINCSSSHPTITGNTISGNTAYTGGGITYRGNSEAITDDNIIYGNSAHHGAGIHYNESNGTISHNTIYDNTADYGGGGIGCNAGSNVIITDNTIRENVSYEYGGGIYCFYGSNVTIVVNTIAANTADSCGGGVACDGSNVAIGNNEIVGNSAKTGGGIWCRDYQDSLIIIINNTISQNVASTYGHGGGIYCHYSDPIIINTIFWGDTPEEIYGNPTISYSDIQNNQWPGDGNIDINPLFRDPGNCDFHLTATYCDDPYDSPCIDAGDPSISDSLIDCSRGLGGVRSDMGAYGGGDSAQVGVEEQLLHIPGRFALFQNYPNPFNPATTVKYNLPKTCDVSIEIYDLLGRRVETLVQGQQTAGHYQIIWDASDYSSGLYFYRIKAGEYAETRKMVLMK
jgi:parallel beta-helix repeat protein/predicted outer membrane repeat protein